MLDINFKSRTLKYNVFIYLIIFSALILIFLWLFQILSLNSFYEYTKTKEVNNVANKIFNKKQYNKNFLDKLSFNNGICIEAVKNNELIYSSSTFNRGCIISKIPMASEDFKLDFINSGKEKMNYKLVNPHFKNKAIVSALKLNSDTYVFVTSSLIPLDSSITVLKSQFIYIIVIVLFLSLIIGYFISKRISKPIENMQKSALKMANGDYSAKFETNTDIKEIDDLGETLNYASDELSKTDELRRDLLSNVGHDLRTPLTMIKAYAEMVRDLTYNNEEKRNNNLNTIIEETERLDLLVGDIIDLSKLQSNMIELNIEEVDLNEIIKNILQKYNILKETENYKFIYNKTKNINIKADKKKIEQVLYNLINNAIQYTGEDNKVFIEIEELNKKYIIKIKDTGKGIKEEDIKYIWDKYYHTEKKHKRNRVGTGLGLSIVKNILELHNFKYGVTSSGSGTTFYFEVPKEK